MSLTEKKQGIRDYFRQWDEGNFDFSEETARIQQPRRPETEEKDHQWAHRPVKRIARREQLTLERLYPWLAAVLAAVLSLFLLVVVTGMPAFGHADTPANTGEPVRRYVEDGLTETGAVNIVAGIILDYRAFDTLGESHVLFTATIAVIILLASGEPLREPEWERRIMEGDLILKKTASVLVPIILLFGIYVILGGHLGPGGGFSGGAIIGGGLILYTIAYGHERLQRLINMRTYRVIVLLALLTYSGLKCYSFYCGANHLETVFSAGTPGNIFSAGMILPLNVAVGIVVALTMYGLYSLFTRREI